MSDHKQRWEANEAKCQEAISSMTIEDAKTITTLNDGKTPFVNAMEYSAGELGLVFGDPQRPKQTLGRTLADHILKLAGI